MGSAADLRHIHAVRLQKRKDYSLSRMADEAAAPPKPDNPARKALKERISKAFKVFDEENNNIADVREVGTIMRSLGVNPTEKELHGMLAQMEEDEPTGFVKYEKFEPVVVKAIEDNEIPTDSEEDIIRAFRALDTDGKGYLTTEELRDLLTKNEEHFSADEISEMLAFAVDPETGNCNFTEYAEKVANYQPLF